MMLIHAKNRSRRGSRSFAKLMELYENNYIFMRRLLPQREELGEEAVSRVDGGVDLHLRVVECSPYTTTVSLTHGFEGESATAPDLFVRIYHDARTAEVLPDSPLHHFRLWHQERPDPRSLTWRWEINRFLNRWLHYCLGEGHGFGPRQPACAGAPACSKEGGARLVGPAKTRPPRYFE